MNILTIVVTALATLLISTLPSVLVVRFLERRNETRRRIEKEVLRPLFNEVTSMLKVKPPEVGCLSVDLWTTWEESLGWPGLTSCWDSMDVYIKHQVGGRLRKYIDKYIDAVAMWRKYLQEEVDARRQTRQTITSQLLHCFPPILLTGDQRGIVMRRAGSSMSWVEPDHLLGLFQEEICSGKRGKELYDAFVARDHARGYGWTGAYEVWHQQKVFDQLGDLFPLAPAIIQDKTGVTADARHKVSGEARRLQSALGKRFQPRAPLF